MPSRAHRTSVTRGSTRLAHGIAGGCGWSARAPPCLPCCPGGEVGDEDGDEEGGQARGLSCEPTKCLGGVSGPSEQREALRETSCPGTLVGKDSAARQVSDKAFSSGTWRKRWQKRGGSRWGRWCRATGGSKADVVPARQAQGREWRGQEGLVSGSVYL